MPCRETFKVRISMSRAGARSSSSVPVLAKGNKWLIDQGQGSVNDVTSQKWSQVEKILSPAKKGCCWTEGSNGSASGKFRVLWAPEKYIHPAWWSKCWRCPLRQALRFSRNWPCEGVSLLCRGISKAESSEELPCEKVNVLNWKLPSSLISGPMQHARMWSGSWVWAVVEPPCPMWPSTPTPSGDTARWTAGKRSAGLENGSATRFLWIT